MTTLCLLYDNTEKMSHEFDMVLGGKPRGAGRWLIYAVMLVMLCGLAFASWFINFRWKPTVEAQVEALQLSLDEVREGQEARESNPAGREPDGCTAG